MVRTPLTPEERRRGERLGELLREARGGRSMVAVAANAGISAETLRKIETGRAPTPAFFTVAAVAGVLGLSMDDVLARCAPEPEPVAGPPSASRPVPASGPLPGVLPATGALPLTA